VIRGRVGDGEHETIEVMKRVHIAMDEEPVAVTPPAPTRAPAPISPRCRSPPRRSRTSRADVGHGDAGGWLVARRAGPR
jgi:hypothetical protein